MWDCSLTEWPTHTGGKLHRTACQTHKNVKTTDSCNRLGFYIYLFGTATETDLNTICSSVRTLAKS